MTDQAQLRIGTEPTKPSKRLSLRTRVTLLVAVSVAAAVALVSLGAYATAHEQLNAQLRTDLQQRAISAAAQAPHRSGPDRSTLLVNNQLALSDMSFDIINSDGQSQLLRPSGQFDEQLIGNQELQVAAGNQMLSNHIETHYQVVAVPYTWIQGAALVLAQPLDSEQRTLRQLAIVLFLISWAGVVVAALAGTAVARGGLVPVQRLTAATERVAATIDLRPIPVAGDDELARLTMSFNAMLAALGVSQERQRQLVADAGHELRTPLTSLRTNVELLVASEKLGAPTLAAADRDELYSDVRAQLDELTTLISDLVELARQDGAEIAPERMELVDVVERALGWRS